MAKGEEGATDKGQFGDNDGEDGEKVDDEISQVIVGVVGAEEEENDGNAEEKFLGGGVLSAVVDLFPHVEVVEGAAVEFERDAANVVKHEIGAKHVCHVGQRPRRFLRDAGNDVVEDFEAGYQDDVDGPSPWKRRAAMSVQWGGVGPRGERGKRVTFCIGPVGVEVGQRSLIADLFKSLGRFMVELEDAAGPPPASHGIAIGHVEIAVSTARRFGAGVVRDGALEENWGRQLGGIDGG